MSEMKRQTMNNAMKSKLNLVVAACALLASIARAQDESGFYRPLTLAPADAAASGGSGTGDDAKANAADLAKTLANPIGALISVPFQNNFDFGGLAHAISQSPFGLPSIRKSRQRKRIPAGLGLPDLALLCR